MGIALFITAGFMFAGKMNWIQGGGTAIGLHNVKLTIAVFVNFESLVDLEVAHTGLTELHKVAGMHERKAKMTELADGFLVLPGGIGTLDELFEAWSWNALGYHAKPFCLVDIGGFWQGLTAFLDHVSSAGFISPNRRAQLLLAQSPAEAIERLDEAARNASQAMVW